MQGGPPRSESKEMPAHPPFKRARDTSRYADWNDRPAVQAFLGETETKQKEVAGELPFFASSHATQPIPPWFPHDGLPAAYAQERVKEYPLGDFNPMLNTSSYVNVTFEPVRARARRRRALLARARSRTSCAPCAPPRAARRASLRRSHRLIRAAGGGGGCKARDARQHRRPDHICRIVQAAQRHAQHDR